MTIRLAPVNVSDFFILYLLDNGIDRIFLYPGGTIAPLINSCVKYGLKLETLKSEQGAGFAALAFGRLTGKPQVVMVTSGPGVTNLITPIADAFYDSTPLIAVCGQISTADLLIRKNVRQRGFQEVPTVDLTRKISKHSILITSSTKFFSELPSLYQSTIEFRKGPVVLDFPMNIQREEVKRNQILLIKKNQTIPKKKYPISKEEIEQICTAAYNSTRPILLLGQGALDDGAFDLYKQIAERIDALVATSFLGIGSYDSDDKRYIGYIGHTGHQSANLAIHESDFVIVLGARLDVRQTGTLVDQFVPNGKVVWVNNDPQELLNPRVITAWKIESSVLSFCERIISKFNWNALKKDQRWKSKIKAIKKSRPEDSPNLKSNKIQPRVILDILSKFIKQSSVIVVTGVGSHQHWAARHLSFKPNERMFLSSGGHGTMGYDIPSAIGAAMAYPNRRVVCVVGDGSFLMNIQELASIAERKLDIKILLLNNKRLGIVSQFQKITWGDDPTTGDFGTPDFTAISQGFGLAANHLNSQERAEELIDWLWNEKGPALLNVDIDSEANIVPMLMGGKAMNDMWKGENK